MPDVTPVIALSADTAAEQVELGQFEDDADRPNRTSSKGVYLAATRLCSREHMQANWARIVLDNAKHTKDLGSWLIRDAAAIGKKSAKQEPVAPKAATTDTDWIVAFTQALCANDEASALLLIASRKMSNVDLVIVDAIRQSFDEIRSRAEAPGVKERDRTTRAPHPGKHRKASFLDRVRRLESQGYLDDALDVLYDSIDESLRADRIDELDRVMAGLDVRDYSDDILIGLLTATLPARSKLPSRGVLLERLKAHLAESGPVDERLLSGL